MKKAKKKEAALKRMEGDIQAILKSPNDSVKVYTHGDGTYGINVTGKIDWQGGLLATLMRLRDYLEVYDLDMPSHYRTSGCETCDYGAEDVYEFVTKNKPE